MTATDAWLLGLLACVAAAGVVGLALRIARSRRLGVSIRLQVFLALTALSFALSAAFVALALSPEELAAASLSSASVRLGFSVLGLAIVAAFSAAFIGSVVAQPLERLTHAAERIAAGERQAVLPLPRGREARALTRAFESMRAELEDRHALETFVADLSHELKNPIAALRASTEVMADALDHDPVAARRFLHRIDEAGRKLERLTADLLTLARLEARGAQPIIRVNLRLILDRAVDGVRALAEARGVSIEVDAANAITSECDADALQRAVENLLCNACEHSPSGARVELHAQAQAHELCILVRDRGTGVDAALAGRLFERFSSTRHGDGGTGLGLAIVRAVAEAHGGRAELRPGSGPGATFALVLPLR